MAFFGKMVLAVVYVLYWCVVLIFISWIIEYFLFGRKRKALERTRGGGGDGGPGAGIIDSGTGGHAAGDGGSDCGGGGGDGGGGCD
jgi:hypothetical protein